MVGLLDPWEEDEGTAERCPAILRDVGAKCDESKNRCLCKCADHEVVDGF